MTNTKKKSNGKSATKKAIDSHVITLTNSSKKRKTKENGRRIGESPNEFSKHPFDKLCTDRPILESVPEPVRIITAKSIINNLLSWDKPENIREHMRELMDSYILNHPDQDEEDRRNLYSSFLIIDESLKDLQQLGNN